MGTDDWASTCEISIVDVEPFDVLKNSKPHNDMVCPIVFLLKWNSVESDQLKLLLIDNLSLDLC